MTPLTIRPLSSATWADFEALFGAKGACGGCWCMLWRVSRREFEAGKGEGNRQAMQNLVEAGAPTGIIGYLDDQPVAWCSVAPRAGFVGLANSRILKPVDEQPVWSITCLFIRKEFRRNGLSRQMILAAADFARQHGAALLEAYPTDPQSEKAPDVFVWTGLSAPYIQAGFREVARRSEHRPILRLEL